MDFSVEFFASVSGNCPVREFLDDLKSGTQAEYRSKLKRLVAVCFQLQSLQGNSPFFLGARDAARIMGTKNFYHANALLGGLVRDGILIEVEKGTRKQATRFRFNLAE